MLIKRGGFIVIGIADKTLEINENFQPDNENIIKLIKNIQDLTQPSVTLMPHRLLVENTNLLILEIPFSEQLHCTSKGLYVIRNIDGNKIIEPHELATIQAEKNLIVFDRKIWKLPYKSNKTDRQGNSIPAWQNIETLRGLYTLIKSRHPKSPYLKNSQGEFTETLCLVSELNGEYMPTTTGILFVGNHKALKEMPFAKINYIRYKNEGSYTPYEYSGTIIKQINQCFQQLKSEINKEEFQFGLFREYVEDYSETVIRELLVNAVAHRDYSRLQTIQIKKYPEYIEIESPGVFPQGITVQNFLRKSNPRNPAIIDIFREIGYAEKAGSGFDKVFTALLTKGKKLPDVIETENTVLIRIYSETVSKTLLKLNKDYKELFNEELELDKAIILNEIATSGSIKLSELEQKHFVNKNRLRYLLTSLQEIDFIQKSGRTSDTKYIIHKSKLTGLNEKRNYLQLKKQEKQKQIEAIMRYLDEFNEISNSSCRNLLNLPDKDTAYVSRLLSEMVEKNLITILREEGHNQRIYGLK